MSISKKLRAKIEELTPKAQQRLKKMAWEDRTTYQEIKKEFGFSANEVEKFMRTILPAGDYKRWKLRQAKRFTLKSKKAALLNKESIYD